MALTSILGGLFAVLAICGLGYTVLSAVLTARFMGRIPAPRGMSPNVTLIKPLHGAHPRLDETLARFCDQDYAGRVQIVFGVHDAADPAVAVVRDLQRRHPDLDIELVVDARLHGANRKASNLINILAHARHDILILSDADIVVDRNYVGGVVAALGAPGVGAVSCLYVGRDDGALWSRLSAMAIDYQFLPSVVLGRALGLAQPCFGSTIALTREVLNAIGGFAAVRDHLADDYEIGRAVRARGYQIAMPPMVVAHLCPEASLRELIGHELRWARTVRQIDPAGHAGSLVTHPLPLALLSALFLGLTPPSTSLILTIIASRVVLKACVDAATGARVGSWWLIPFRDVLSFGVFVASFAVNTVGWQGRRFRVGRDGVLSHP